MRDVENVRPPGSRPAATRRPGSRSPCTNRTIREKHHPVASGISFREGDLGDAKVVDLIKVCDFDEAKASGKYATPPSRVGDMCTIAPTPKCEP